MKNNVLILLLVSLSVGQSMQASDGFSDRELSYFQMKVAAKKREIQHRFFPFSPELGAVQSPTGFPLLSPAVSLLTMQMKNLENQNALLIPITSYIMCGNVKDFNRSLSSLNSNGLFDKAHAGDKQSMDSIQSIAQIVIDEQIKFSKATGAQSPVIAGMIDSLDRQIKAASPSGQATLARLKQLQELKILRLQAFNAGDRESLKLCNQNIRRVESLMHR